MKWQKYTLYKLTRTQNSIGQFIEAYVAIGEIDVVVSNKLYTTISNDVLYRKFGAGAITKFKEFEKDGSYILESETQQFKVSSFNSAGRYAQLLLEETNFKLEKSTLDLYFDGAIDFSGGVDTLG